MEEPKHSTIGPTADIPAPRQSELFATESKLAHWIPVAPSRARLHDIWTFGPHRILCGSILEPGEFDRLSGGRHVDAANVDPPYGMDAVNKSNSARHSRAPVDDRALPAVMKNRENAKRLDHYREIVGDSSTFTARAAYRFLRNLGVGRNLFWGGNFFADFLPPSRCWLLWVKSVEAAPSFSSFEVVWTDANRPARAFRGAPPRVRRHPTEKNPDVLARMLDHVDAGKSLLDPFLGSGSSLVAAHSTNRFLLGSEIVPANVDLVLELAESLGFSPTLESRLSVDP